MDSLSGTARQHLSLAQLDHGLVRVPCICIHRNISAVPSSMEHQHKLAYLARISIPVVPNHRADCEITGGASPPCFWRHRARVLLQTQLRLLRTSRDPLANRILQPLLTVDSRRVNPSSGFWLGAPLSLSLHSARSKYSDACFMILLRIEVCPREPADDFLGSPLD